jgi:hypothetical protein
MYELYAKTSKAGTVDERYVGREVSDILQITRRDIFKGFIWAE